MSTSQPIKEREDILKLKNYFLAKGNKRNFCLVTLGLNTALRISDILSLTWNDLYDFQKEGFRKYIYLVEQKTGKETQICLNHAIIEALLEYMEERNPIHPQEYIICNNRNPKKPITRIQAHRLIRQAAEELGMEGHISCHSLRKTFGYQAWRLGAEPALLMNIYNHSNYQVTKRYLGIEQEDKDKIFLKINL